MSDITTTPKTKTETRTRPSRPHMHRVILLNDDYTPREFVITVLQAVFRMSPAQANGVMLAAHQRGVCVVAVYTREVAETKAAQGTEMGQREGYPLTFTTQPED